MKRREISFDLIKNARDSLRHAVELLAFSDHEASVSLKRAIVGAAHCLELLLKERLRRLHPAFVWENVDKYPSLSARTVTAEKALSRLESIAGIAFTTSDRKALESCRKMRNAIEHYEFTVGESEAKVILGRTLSFLFSFARTELNLDLEAEFRRDDTWSSLLDNFYEFAELHASKVSSDLWNEGRPTQECPACGHETLDVFDATCAMCGHLWTPDEDTDEEQGDADEAI